MPEPGPIRRFSELLSTLEHGDLEQDLSNELRATIALMNEEAINNGGNATKASLTVTINMTLEDGVFAIVPVTSLKRPKKSRSRSVFWSDAEDNLTHQNPRQAQLPLRTVREDPAEVRKV